MRVVRNDYTAFFDQHPDELQKFPGQLGRAADDGAFHLGGGENTEGIDRPRSATRPVRAWAPSPSSSPPASWSVAS